MTDETFPALPVAAGTSTGKRLRNTRLGPGLSSKRVELVEAMIFDGLPRKLAAEKVGMTDRAARYALSDRVVMAAYRKSLQILRESEKPRSIHKLAELRDQDKSLKVSLEASKFLALDEHAGTTIQVGVNVNVQPGYICDVSRHAEKARQILQQSGGVARPVIAHEA